MTDRVLPRGERVVVRKNFWDTCASKPSEILRTTQNQRKTFKKRKESGKNSIQGGVLDQQHCLHEGGKCTKRRMNPIAARDLRKELPGNGIPTRRFIKSENSTKSLTPGSREVQGPKNRRLK